MELVMIEEGADHPDEEVDFHRCSECGNPIAWSLMENDRGSEFVGFLPYSKDEAGKLRCEDCTMEYETQAEKLERWRAEGKLSGPTESVWHPTWRLREIDQEERLREIEAWHMLSDEKVAELTTSPAPRVAIRAQKELELRESIRKGQA